MVYLTIGGNVLDDVVNIQSLTATFGRTTITEQPQPSTFNCSYSLIDGQTLANPIEPGDAISWYIEDPLSGIGRVLAYVGVVSDVSVGLNWGNGSGLYVYTVTGVDYSAKLSQIAITNAYAKQFEGTRIAAILSDAGGYTGHIETPGSYELMLSPASNDNALAMMQSAANSAMGYLYMDCTNTGAMVYQAYTSRKTNPLITLTADMILASDYGLTSTVTTIANSVQVTHRTGTSAIASDGPSITKYGTRSAIKETTLYNSTDATSQSLIYLATRKDAKFRLQTLTINSAVLSDADKSALANLTLGNRIQTSGLPTPEMESFYGFVEGYSRTTGRGQDIITLQLSSYGDFYPYTLWSDLNGTDTWNTYALSTTKWSDIT